MDPNNILTATTGSISSRFQSQAEIDEARENRKKEWAEAYKRIGQEPPPEEPQEEYDSRTLFERLQSQKDIKKEEWDSKMKLSNQWRGIDAGEQAFLAEKEAEKRAEQRKVEEREAEELREYRERQALKSTTEPKAVPASSAPKKALPRPVKKDVKSLMKGVVVKKKPKAAGTAASPATKPASGASSSESPVAKAAAVDGESAKEKDEGAVKAGTKREAPVDESAEDEKRRKTDTGVEGEA
ncbi:hypothetical protein IAT38_003553 [Cryptococcus sp. DSM 104549]